MTKQLLFRFRICLFFLFVLATSFSRSQNNQSPTNLVSGQWQSAMLRSDGKVVLNGVEAYCTKATCNGTEYIFIKFVNTNNYQVKLEWVDGIYLNGVWNYSQNPNPKEFVIAAGATAEGSCNGDIKLKVTVNSLVNDPSPNKHFSVTGLKVTQ